VICYTHTGVRPARLRAALTHVWCWPASRFRLSSVEQVPLNRLSTFEPDRMRELTKRVTLRTVALVPSRASGGGVLSRTRHRNTPSRGPAIATRSTRARECNARTLDLPHATLSPRKLSSEMNAEMTAYPSFTVLAPSQM